MLCRTGPPPIFCGEFLCVPEILISELRACCEQSLSATGVVTTEVTLIAVSDYSAAYVGNNPLESHRTLEGFLVTLSCENIWSVHSCLVELTARGFSVVTEKPGTSLVCGAGVSPPECSARPQRMLSLGIFSRFSLCDLFARDSD